jgi:hypothetical protein
MATDRDKIIEERKRLRSEYRELFDSVSSVLFRHDPIEINFETNTDEYEPEVCTILPRLGDCASEADVARVVHEEFMRWFGEDSVSTADQYAEISAEIWRLWLRFQQEAKQAKLPSVAEGDVGGQSASAKKEQFGFGFYLVLGVLVVGLSLSSSQGPPAGSGLMNLLAVFCGLQAYLRRRTFLQRVCSLLLFAVGLGLLFSPLVAAIYVGWLRR